MRSVAISSWQSRGNWAKRTKYCQHPTPMYLPSPFCCVRTMASTRAKRREEKKMIFGIASIIFKPFRVFVFRSASKVDDSFKCLFSLIGNHKNLRAFAVQRTSAGAYTMPPRHTLDLICDNKKEHENPVRVGAATVLWKRLHFDCKNLAGVHALGSRFLCCASDSERLIFICNRISPEKKWKRVCATRSIFN